MLHGTNRMLAAAGLGIAVVGGAAAWARTRPEPDPGAPLEPGHVDAADAPNGAGSARPVTADGPGDLAVAWWPQDISLRQAGGDATLRFQSTVVNLGGEAVDLRAGDRVVYTVRRSDDTGAEGALVGRGSARLDRGDVEPFPLDVGVEVGRPVDSLGRRLEHITSLAPQTATAVGADHPSQTITIHDAVAGTYVLRQQVVRGDGSRDASTFDDVRLTEFRLDGAGGILHLGSRYGGPTDRRRDHP